MNKEWMPVVAGVMEIIAAVLACIGVCGLIFASMMINTVPDIQNDPDVPIELITGLLIGVAGFVFLLGIVCLIGGVSGIRRRGWGWTLAGSIAAVFIVAPAGIIALALALIGEKEFGERAA